MTRQPRSGGVFTLWHIACFKPNMESVPTAERFIDNGVALDLR
mgnify:CR=1 FL=1